MRRFAHFVYITVFFSLFICLTAQTAYAIKTCEQGQPQAGKGGAVGDKCNAGAADECCKVPDGNPNKSLQCDNRGNSPTQNTCILVKGFNQAGAECLNDNYCDRNNNLRCVNKKCTKAACIKTGGDCGSTADCCTNSNLTCSKLIGAARGTCTVAACKKVDGACKTAADCCQGQHLTCDPDVQKCVSTCPSKGQACSSADPGAAGSCCSDQNIVCDIDRIVDPSKPVQCVSKDDLANVRDHGNTSPKVVQPPPPSPPCAQYDAGTGRCLQVITGFGNISTDPGKFITRLYGLLLSASGGIAVLLLMRAGYKIQTSRGNPEALKEGTEQATATIVGLFFLIFAFVLLQVIAGDLLKIPGITP